MDRGNTVDVEQYIQIILLDNKGVNVINVFGSVAWYGWPGVTPRSQV